MAKQKKASKEWGLDVGTRVRDRRTMLGFTLNEVAQKMGCNWGYLQLLETKGANPSSYAISQLADALETSTDDLLGHCTPGSVVEATPAELVKVATMEIRLLHLVKLIREVANAIERECGPGDLTVHVDSEEVRK